MAQSRTYICRWIASAVILVASICLVGFFIALLRKKVIAIMKARSGPSGPYMDMAMPPTYVESQHPNNVDPERHHSSIPLSSPLPPAQAKV